MISNRPHRGCVGGGWPTHSRVSNVWDTMDQLEAASLRLVVTTIRPQSDEKMHCAPTDSKAGRIPPMPQNKSINVGRFTLSLHFSPKGETD